MIIERKKIQIKNRTRNEVPEGRIGSEIFHLFLLPWEAMKISLYSPPLLNAFSLYICVCVCVNEGKAGRGRVGLRWRE